METLCHFEHHRYSGLEPAQAFDIVYGAHFEHRLLSSRRSTMEHHRLMVGGVRLETGSYDFPVIARGAMPQDSVCIGLVADGADNTRYNAEAIGEDEIQIYAPGADLMYHAAGPSRWVNFTAPQPMLQAFAIDRIGRPLTLPRHGVLSTQLAPGGRAALAQLASDVFELAKGMQPASISPTLAQELSRAFVIAYVDALCGAEMAHHGPKSATAWRHHFVILACERLVTRTGPTGIQLADIARQSGYTLRSLELIFRDSVGMPPSRYFLNMRLNGALRDFLNGGPHCSVTAVASRWGFQHLSRFAQQYRNAFGESPRQTLGRAKAAE